MSVPTRFSANSNKDYVSSSPAQPCPCFGTAVARCRFQLQRYHSTSHFHQWLAQSRVYIYCLLKSIRCNSRSSAYITQSRVYPRNDTYQECTPRTHFPPAARGRYCRSGAGLRKNSPMDLDPPPLPRPRLVILFPRFPEPDDSSRARISLQLSFCTGNTLCRNPSRRPPPPPPPSPGARAS